MNTLFNTLLLAMFVSAAPAQRIWRVSCHGGPNVDFTDLPPAIAAAAAGDVIWVYYVATTCPSRTLYNAAVIDKPLTIVGFSTLGTPGYSIPTIASVDGLLEIRDIPAGSRVVISNISLGNPPIQSSVPPSGIVATNCAGEILLEDIDANIGGLQNHHMEFRNCANVTIRGAEMFLSTPMRFVDSVGVLSTTSLRWSWPFPLPAYAFTSQEETVVVENSDVTLIGTFVDGPSRQSATLDAHSAVRVDSGQLRIGPDTRLRGGLRSGNAVDSVNVTDPALSQIYHDARSYPLTMWTPLNLIPADIHSTYHGWVVAGEDYRTSVVGPPNGWGMLAVGTAAIQPLDLGFGILAMELSTVQVIGLQPLNQVGYTDWIRRCPPMVPVGHMFAFQAAVLAPSGEITLALPSPFTVGWPHGVIP